MPATAACPGATSLRGRGERPDSLTVVFASGDTTPQLERGSLVPARCTAPVLADMPLVPPPLPARRLSRRRAAAHIAWLLAAVAAAGCGKKGPPLAPLPRVPAAVSDWAATRRDDTVRLSFVTPTANAGGDVPADVAVIEVYAMTARTAPSLEPGRVPTGMTLVGSVPVLRPLPPPPRGETPPVPPIPRGPGVEQGAPATLYETLTPEVRALAAGPTDVDLPASDTTVPAVSPPLVFAPAVATRYYAAVAVSRSGRRSAWTSVARVPLGPPSGAPVDVRATYDATTWTLTWTPGAGARVPEAPAADVLESRPLGGAAPATRFHVYEATAAGAPAAAPGEPVRLTEAPVAGTTTQVPGVTFGRPRCFLVRGLDTIDGVDVEGPASAPICGTPADTFPPPAPSGLEAVGGAGVISLIWEGVDAPDLLGYLVLRGEGGAEPTTVLTPAPITASSFEDRTVTPGTRYVYVVVAVDSATPANRSAPSNRAEETARQ